MKRKLLTETPVCPRERLVIISYTPGLSFAEETIGPLAAIITTIFYLLALYLFTLPNTPKNPFASIYSETWIKTTHQHLLLLVGFDTLIYRKYYDTPPILVGHQRAVLGGGPGGLTTRGRGPGAGRATPWCGWPVAPLRLLFGLLEASVNIRRFGFCFIQFREYFLCNFSETQKQQKTGNWHYGISLIG
jgi:hypothetical protein